MERIQNILQRIQELYYSKHQKSVIDIDLMLDYTRVMYADLLEWKGSMPVVKDEHAKQQVTDKKPEEVAIVADPGPVIAAAVDSTGNDYEQVHTEENAVIEDPQQQIAELIQVEDRGISFEPPHPAPHPEIIDEVLIEEEPEVNEPVENIEIPVAQPEQARVKTAASITGIQDIRSGIGINDKYLFLNELFNNHKTEYEEALDHLNRFNGYDEAYNWVIANTAVNNKWAEDDETVQNFFSVLKKHFSVSR